MDHKIASIIMNRYLQEKYNVGKEFVEYFNVTQIIPPEVIDGKRPEQQFEAHFEKGKVILVVNDSTLNLFSVKVVEKE